MIKMFNCRTKRIHLFYLLILSSSVHCDVSKCCPIGLNLKIEHNSVVGCENTSMENQTPFDAYNINYSNGSSLLPQCSYTVRKLFESDENYAAINGCVDRSTNGDLFALTCANDPTVEIHELNRCCASGHSYDHSERFCAFDFDSQPSFQRFFGDAVIWFNTFIPDCGYDEVFVEYVTIEHEIRFENHDLVVNGDILHPNKFCVEGLVNGADDKWNADHLIIRSCRPKSICGRIPCIRRCCKTDQVIKPGKCVSHPNQTNLLPTFHDIDFPIAENKSQNQFHPREYGVLHSLACKHGKAPLMPSDTSYLHRDGNFYFESTKYDTEEYCVENTQLGSNIEIRMFICVGDFNSDKFKFYPIGLIISCIFLALTLIVYLALPKLLNIHGKTLVCYVISFLATYILLAIVHWNSETKITFCYEIAFALVYSFVAVFCWQTVMCFDIWSTFGSLRSSYILRHNKRENRKFFYYSAYAWGFPFLWTMFVLFASKYKPFADEWNPSLGDQTCFFSSKIRMKEHFLYFVLPNGIHVFINLILFILTAIYCSRVKREIHRMQSNVDDSSVSAKRKKFIASRAMFV